MTVRLTVYHRKWCFSDYQPLHNLLQGLRIEPFRIISQSSRMVTNIQQSDDIIEQGHHITVTLHSRLITELGEVATPIASFIRDGTE